jgi:hypothetical protein
MTSDNFSEIMLILSNYLRGKKGGKLELAATKIELMYAKQ